MTGIQKQYRFGEPRADGRVWGGMKARKLADGSRVPQENWLTPLAWFRYNLATCITNARKRAKESGVPFDITRQYIEALFPADSMCPALGMHMSYGGDRSNSPSLDRIVPELGYVEGNVIWVSYRANRIKNDASVEELRRVADFYTTR